MSSSQCVNRGRAYIVVNRDYSEYHMCVHVVWQVTFLRSFQDLCSIVIYYLDLLMSYKRPLLS